MSSIDIDTAWTRADECALAVNATGEASRRERLTLMRKVWMALAEGGPSLDDDSLIAEVDRLHGIVLQLAANLKP
jgi:hypothetical protein